MNNKITSILILILFGIIILQYCNKPKQINTEPKIIKIDSIVYQIKYVDSSKSKPQLTKNIKVPYQEWDTVYIPSENKDSLKQQYLEALSKLYEKNIYDDSLNISDTNGLKGTVYTHDTIQFNKFKGRKYNFNIDYPKVVKTITIEKTQPKKAQVYVGFGIIGNQTNFVNGINANISLKTKSDKIFEISSIFINNQTNFGIGIKYKL